MSFARLVSSYGALLMRISRKLLTDLFFLVVLFVASGATEALTMGSAGADPQGSPMMKVFWACIYLVVILRLIPRYRQVLGLFRYNKCFALLLLLAIYSTRWSVDPRLTLSKSLPLLLSALIGLDFARRYSIGEQLRLVWMVLATVMVLGVIAQVFFPGVVPDLDFEPGGDARRRNGRPGGNSGQSIRHSSIDPVCSVSVCLTPIIASSQIAVERTGDWRSRGDRGTPCAGSRAAGPHRVGACRVIARETLDGAAPLPPRCDKYKWPQWPEQEDNVDAAQQAVA